MNYELRFPTASLEKRFNFYFNSIPSTKIRKLIWEKIAGLESNPRPFGEPKIKPPIHISSYVAEYRVRIGDYRVLYNVDDKKKIVWLLVLRKKNKKTYK